MSPIQIEHSTQRVATTFPTAIAKHPRKTSTSLSRACHTTILYHVYLLLKAVRVLLFSRIPHSCHLRQVGPTSLIVGTGSQLRASSSSPTHPTSTRYPPSWTGLWRMSSVTRPDSAAQVTTCAYARTVREVSTRRSSAQRALSLVPPVTTSRTLHTWADPAFKSRQGPVHAPTRFVVRPNLRYPRRQHAIARGTFRRLASYLGCRMRRTRSDISLRRSFCL